MCVLSRAAANKIKLGDGEVEVDAAREATTVPWVEHAGTSDKNSKSSTWLKSVYISFLFN